MRPAVSFYGYQIVLVNNMENSSSSWEGTITLDGQADVTITGNDTYAPLQIGQDRSQQAVVTLEDSASLKCLQTNMDEANEYTVSGFSLASGNGSLLLKGKFREKNHQDLTKVKAL